MNHLAQAARAVLQNQQQISQMLADLNRVDFTNVQVCLTPQSPVLTVSIAGAGELGVWLRPGHCLQARGELQVHATAAGQSRELGRLARGGRGEYPQV